MNRRTFFLGTAAVFVAKANPIDGVLEHVAPVDVVEFNPMPFVEDRIVSFLMKLEAEVTHRLMYGDGSGRSTGILSPQLTTDALLAGSGWQYEKDVGHWDYEKHA